MDMLAFPNIKMHGNGQMTFQHPWHVGALSTKIGNFVAWWQHVANMSATFPAKGNMSADMSANMSVTCLKNMSAMDC